VSGQIHPSILISALTLPAVTGGEQVLIPAGTFDAPTGAMLGTGPWTLTDAAGAVLSEKLRATGRDLPIDFEHQTLLSRSNGQPAPASGWVQAQDIAWRPGVGVVATAVKWTESAAKWIAEGAYRFLSPVFRYDENGNVTDLLHVALTNTPALPNLPEVSLAAASLYPTGPRMMDDDLKERLLYLLNLPTLTTDAELSAELDKLKTMLGSMGDMAAGKGLLAVLREQQGRLAAAIVRADQATQQLAAAQAQVAAPLDVVRQLQSEIAALRQAEVKREREALMEAALSDGRLVKDTPLYAYALSLDLTGLTGLVGVLQPIAALSRSQTGGRPPGDKKRDPLLADLSEEDLAVAKAMGIELKQFAAARAAEVAH
jgi:phage I-like protein